MLVPGHAKPPRWNVGLNMFDKFFYAVVMFNQLTFFIMWEVLVPGHADPPP